MGWFMAMTAALLTAGAAIVAMRRAAGLPPWVRHAQKLGFRIQPNVSPVQVVRDGARTLEIGPHPWLPATLAVAAVVLDPGVKLSVTADLRPGQPTVETGTLRGRPWQGESLASGRALSLLEAIELTATRLARSHTLELLTEFYLFAQAAPVTRARVLIPEDCDAHTLVDAVAAAEELADRLDGAIRRLSATHG